MTPSKGQFYTYVKFNPRGNSFPLDPLTTDPHETSMSKSRKELNENELAGAISDQMDNIRPHLPKILIGFIAIAAVVFGINYVISSRSAAKEAKAINLVLFSVENSAAGSQATLDQQIDDFPNDPTTAWAYLIKADRSLTSGLEKIFVDRLAGRDFVQRSLEDFEKAIELGGDDARIKQRALFGWARALESLGRFDQAAAKFSELVELGDHPFTDLARKGIERVNEPQNREFYVMLEKRENNALAQTPGSAAGGDDAAPGTDTGLLPRPDLTYPGEEPVTGAGLQTPANPDAGKEAPASDNSPGTDAPPAPPENVLDQEKSPTEPKKSDEPASAEQPPQGDSSPSTGESQPEKSVPADPKATENSGEQESKKSDAPATGDGNTDPASAEKDTGGSKEND